ncbi:3-oxoacyl-[acyl-carrier protein] reductase [Labilithrix luteola]|uniref:3-oxoacyl-[acyl-carrier protein] reductase n=1 Tax=Labilithrix luteola TaxID=1391654 RepID=A0A0K1PRI7_9BACT|nr:SDR family oxidoreductase [Labilithrix luteola]AKU95714.1 3-oxoacyl-[acyl-carrier protein] reductase [Labilithrix luteola]
MVREEKKVAIITGASQGIGAGLVRAYRERGFRVVATARTIKASQDEHVVAVAGDIRERRTAEAVVGAAKERFGRLDTLVNNAGVFVAKPFVQYTQEDFDLVTGVNVAGFFHITQLAAAEMLARQSGHIVNITATLADQPRASVPAALASLTKGGISAVTTGLAIEFAKQGVRVNAVAPGIIDTPMHSPEAHDFLAKLHPMGRVGAIEDVANAVLFLESAPFITGEVVHVDGGWHAGQG